MADNAQRYLDRYKKIESLAYRSIWETKQSYSQADVQERIRTMALIVEVVDAEDTPNGN
jgi:hypothetical protein